MEALRIYCLPVSGGGFPVQVAFLAEMYEAFKLLKKLLNGERDYSPDIMLGASGGNLACYLASAGDFSYQGILRICEFLNAKMFIKNWGPLHFIPSLLFIPFTGSLFTTGENSSHVLKIFFDSTTIQKVEILTLVTNKNKLLPKIFSNRSPENSFFGTEITLENQILDEAFPIEYIDGNVEKLCQIIQSSAAIPIITRPIEFEGEKYEDGGTTYASPLGTLEKRLQDKIIETGKLLHFFYFSPYDLDDYEDMSKYTHYGDSSFKKNLLRLIHSEALRDRKSAINILESKIKRRAVVTQYKHTNTIELSRVIEENLEGDFVVIFYPTGYKSIDLLKFTSIDIKNLIDETRLDYNFELWK